MPLGHLQHCIEEPKENSEAYQKMLPEKSIVQVQICYGCGRKLNSRKDAKSAHIVNILCETRL